MPGLLHLADSEDESVYTWKWANRSLKCKSILHSTTSVQRASKGVAPARESALIVVSIYSGMNRRKVDSPSRDELLAPYEYGVWLFLVVVGGGVLAYLACVLL
jgi:hypothetical protein